MVQVRGHEQSDRVRRGAYGTEVVEARVERAQLAGTEPVQLAPGGAGSDRGEGALDEPQKGPGLLTVVAVGGEVDGAPLVRGGGPDVIRGGAADLERDGDAHVLLLEASPQRCESLLEAADGQCPLRFAETHPARRGEHPRGIVDHARAGEDAGGERGGGAAKQREGRGTSAQQLPRAVAEDLLLEQLGGPGGAVTGRVRGQAAHGADGGAGCAR